MKDYLKLSLKAAKPRDLKILGNNFLSNIKYIVILFNNECSPWEQWMNYIGVQYKELETSAVKLKYI